MTPEVIKDSMVFIEDLPSIEELTKKSKVTVTENQLKVMQNKYLRGESVELWLRRIARNIAMAELLYNKEINLNEILNGVFHEIIKSDYDQKSFVVLLQSRLPDQSNDTKWKNFLKFEENLIGVAAKNPVAAKILREKEENFYEMLSNFDFLPNSPCLMNAGRDLQMLHACFVIPVPDSMEGIMKAATAQVMIHQSGGGTGFAFSRIRPEGDIVKSTKGIASGPMSFIRIFDTATDVVKQGGCVALDTRVATEKGLVKIGDIVPKNLSVNGWGQHTLTIMTDDGPKLSDEAYNNGESEVITLKTKNGYKVTATPEHRFRTINEEGDYVWKHMKDIKEDDWLALQLDSYPEIIDYKLPEFNYNSHFNAKPIMLPEIATPGLGELIGYFVGDGAISINKHGTGRFILSFGDDEPDVKKYIHSLMFNIFGILPTEQKKHNDNSTNSFYTRTILVHWLKNIGADKKSALTTKVPEIVFKAGKEFAKGFIRGLFTADGTITKEGYISLSSASKTLIDDTQQLLLSLGIPSYQNKVYGRKIGKVYSDNSLYKLNIITERGLKRFSDEIGFLSEKKNKRLNIKDIKWEFNDIIPNQEDKIKKIYCGPGRGCAPGKTSKGANRKLYRDLQHYFTNVQAKRNLTYKRLQYLAEKHQEIKNSSLSWFLTNNQFYDKVISLEKGKTYTVDLSVPENNTYIANGFVSHNTRRGANMGILYYKHPDIRKFITSKSKDKGFLQNFNISVAFDKDFFYAVENDGEFDLVHPASKKVIGREKAREFFDLMSKCAWETGDPGFVVIDRINETSSNPTPKLGQIESTNPCGEQPLLPWEPCFAPDTLITTNKGLETIEDLYQRQQKGEDIIIATDNKTIDNKGIEFRPAIVSRTGYKKIVEVKLNNGQSLKVTPNHKLFTKEGWKRADKLTKKDLVFIQDGSIYNKDTIEQEEMLSQAINSPNEEYLLYGWLSGDGYFVEGERPSTGLCFGPDEKFAQSKLIPLFREIFECNSNSYIAKDDIVSIATEKKIAIEKLKKLGFKGGRAPNKEIPKPIFTSAPEKISAYLGGLFSADGEVSAYRRRVRLSSASKKLITQTQMLLLNFGIKSRISKSEVDKRVWYELAINAQSYDKFAELIGFPLSPIKQELLMLKLNLKIRDRINNTYSRIRSVKEGGFSEVYDITEPETHSLIANGIVAHNCTLGSINISNHIKKINGKNIVDYEKLVYTTRLAVNFLENVVDMSNYALQEIELISKTNRRIGLGVMGWAETLIKLEIPYDSEDAVTLAEELMFFINTKALEASEELAEERGVFYNFKDSIFDKTGQYFRGQALRPRNCARTTIAPTGTIAITAGLQGSGIEPFFAIVYKRYQAEAIDSLKRGEEPEERFVYYEVVPLFLEVAENYNWFGLNKNTLLKKIAENHGSVRGIKEIPAHIQKIFVSSHDLHWKTHIDHQAAFQKYTDNAVSKTINMPNTATIEEIKSAYFYAYKTGCKGVTVYRDGCKEIQTLSTSTTTKKTNKEVDLSQGTASDYYEIQTGYGPLHVNIVYDKTQGPLRIFTSIPPLGTELSGLTSMLGVFMSKAIQAGYQPEKAIKHLNSVKGDRPLGFGPNRVDSVAHGVAVALKRHLEKTGKIENKLQLKLTELKEEKKQEHCTKCYSPNVEYMNGCSTPTCLDCGHSECS